MLTRRVMRAIVAFMTNRTLVVEFWGGPGVGKSTMAADLFVRLKKLGINVELITEYAKGWAWDGKSICELDQIYILSKQLKQEARLYGKVDVIITDSPLAFSAFYAKHYHGTDYIKSAVDGIIESAGRSGVDRLTLLLCRPEGREYQQSGRYEDAEAAKCVDSAMSKFFYGYCRDGLTVSSSDSAVGGIVKVVLDRLNGRGLEDKSGS